MSNQDNAKSGGLGSGILAIIIVLFLLAGLGSCTGGVEMMQLGVVLYTKMQIYYCKCENTMI